MDSQTLVSMLDFAHARVLGSLDAIAASKEPPEEVLIWRPAKNRAHIAWQALHCAATNDKYLNVNIKGLPQPQTPDLVQRYGGGSVPSDEGQPTLSAIRAALQGSFSPLREYTAGLSPAETERVVGPADRQRRIGDSIILLAWHYAHHQGQLHLTWNMYRQANGLV